MPIYIFHNHGKLLITDWLPIHHPVKCPPSLLLKKCQCFRKSKLATWTTKPPLSAPSLQPISILPSPSLLYKLTKSILKCFFAFANPQAFSLSMSFSRGACASSLLCHSLMKHSGADAHRSTKTAGQETHTTTLAFLAQQHCCCWLFSPWTKSSLLPSGCHLSCDISGSFASSPLLNRGTPEKKVSELGFPYYFRGPHMSQGLSVIVKIAPQQLPIHSSILSNCERFWATQGSAEQRDPFFFFF